MAWSAGDRLLWAQLRARRGVLTAGGLATLAQQLAMLGLPWCIQRALDAMPYHLATTAWSPRRVLRARTAHCLEGAVFAAAAGGRPL